MRDEDFSKAEESHSEGKMIMATIMLCISIVATFTFCALRSLGYI